jgi:superfamily II DNA or RNA helicase
MINLNIQWSDPVQIEKNDEVLFQRSWVIPKEYLNQFFTYWKSNKLDLKDRGYGVTKIDTCWILTETKDNPTFFKDPIKKTKEKVDESLPIYEVKNFNGLRPWQVDAVSKIVASINKWGAAVDGSDVGCHAKGQLILMYDGSLKKVEEIKVDDVVMGWQGPQIVTQLHTGNEEMIKIIPAKGDSFVVNKNHILTVKTTNLHKTKKSVGGYLSNMIYDIKVSDYIKLPHFIKNKMKLIRGKVECWSTTRQPLSPYLMGILLGGGGLSEKKVTFTSQVVKCENIFIPIEYKICDVQQRLEILAGLLDSSGYYRNGRYDFTVKSYQLAKDVEYISRSLGFAAYTLQVKKSCVHLSNVDDYYKVSISGDCSIIPTKQTPIHNQKKNVLTVGFTIETLGPDNFYGFSLSGDGRFLLGDFTITHNTGKTYTATAVARELDMDIMVVCPKAVMESWKRVIKNHFKYWGKCVGIVNYESLRIGKTDSIYASFVKRRDTRRKEFVWKIPKNTLIVWDEAQKLKNSKTKNSETCMAALKAGYKMLFCSATMATNPLELRTVGQCIKLFNNNKQYYDWAYAHGVVRGRFGMEFTGDRKALSKLNNDIFNYRGVRLKRDTIPNFPDSQIIAECYEMEKEDQNKINAAYDEMRLELLKIDKLLKKDKKTSELTAILRMRQSVEMIKIPLFLEMIEESLENNMSVAVFLNFTESINALAKRLNTKCIINGEVKDKDRQQNIDDFQSDKQRVIIINTAAGGAGISLHDINGKHPRIALISPSYSAVNMRQSMGRVWRDGSKSKSIQKIIFVANTIEEKVCDSVNQKLANLDLLNDGDLT